MIDTSLHQSEPVMLPGRPWGRTVRSIAGYALLTALMIRSELTVFIPATVIHSAIRNGRRSTWIMLALATLLGFALFAINPATELQMMQRFSYLAVTVLAIALPSMIALPMIERGETFGRVLMIGRLRSLFEFAAKRKLTAPGVYLFRNFALPEWALFAFILGGVAPLLKGTLQAVSANMLMVAVFLFLLQGFALLRFLLASAGVGFIGALFAFGFTFITGVGPMLLGVAGLFDPFFDFRHYKKRKDDSHEGHSD